MAILGLISTATPASADGPALSHLTVEGQTITLTSRNPIPAMDPDTPGEVHLSFAQMHLGFPLPPFLSMSLREAEANGGWSVTNLRLERNSTSPPMVFAPDQLQVTEAFGSTDAMIIVIEGEALVPNTGPIPIHIETHFWSP